MSERIFNFSAGPAVLPLTVLEEVQRDLITLPGVGMSVLEISHRSSTFTEIIEAAEARLRELLSIPEDYAVLFLQGGATMQFSMLPMNFLPPGGSADYVMTGSWSEKAADEARKVGAVRVAASTEEEKYRRIPRPDELSFDPQAAYAHYTSNNTIFGTEWSYVPDAGGLPLVVDASSDFLSAPFELARHALLYAGAQKNLGPAGTTVVILRKDLLDRIPGGLPTMLDYGAMVKGKSLYNTPPVFGIYVIRLVLDWIAATGGLEAMGRHNDEKARTVYDAIDASSGFYRGHAEPGSRSKMNITFRLPSEELESKFAKQAQAAGMDGLKGHRSVGGLRASVYNAFPKEGTKALAEFMKEFQRKNG